MDLAIRDYRKSHRVKERYIWRKRSVAIVQRKIRGKERAEECDFISGRDSYRAIRTEKRRKVDL